MPFIRVDAEAWDERIAELPPEVATQGLAAERPSGEFQYESATATVPPGKLEPSSKLVAQALIAAGITHFAVLYDGGHDEGFVHPDHFLAGLTRRSILEVSRSLIGSPLLPALRASSKGQRYDPYASASDEQAIETALYELAMQYATPLLGEGFGTGEYSLYGAFVTNLATGEVTDDSTAQPRRDL